MAALKVDFAFESTLSGKVYAARLKRWREEGYRIEIIFFRLTSARLAIQRVASRVRQGGHHVPKTDIIRRFERGWNNFEAIYRPLTDAWSVYDNSGDVPTRIEFNS